MLTKIICGVFLVLIVGAAFWYVLKCRRRLSAVNAEVERVLAAAAVDEALKESEVLKPAWNAFEKTLTRTDAAVYSTTDAAEFFSVQSLTQGLNMTFWQNYGGIFTGLGILGTFFGLTVGLYGVDVTSGDIDTLKGSIANLLSGVETAFVTSLFGILFAIIYSIAHHGLMATLGENIRSLTDRLDETFPRRSVEDWLAEKFSEARRQTRALQSLDLESQSQSASLQSMDAQSQSQTVALQSMDAESKEQTVALKNIGEDVANAIYDGLDERMNEAVDKFCNRLEEKILPQVDRICAAIEHLGAGGGEKIGKIFSDRVGEQMDRFSAALDRFSDSIDEKLKAADEISKIMNDRLLNALQELSDKLKQNSDADTERRDTDYKKFSTMLDGLIKMLNGNANANAAQINAAVNAFREIVNRHNETTQKTFARIQTLLADTESLLEIMDKASLSFKQAADPVKQSTLQLTKNLTETSAQMKTLADANYTTRENLAALSTQLAAFVKNFNGIADQLERATTIITDSLDNYNAKTSKELSDALTKFSETVNGAYSGLNEIVNDLTEALDDFRKRG